MAKSNAVPKLVENRYLIQAAYVMNETRSVRTLLDYLKISEAAESRI